MKAYTEKSVVLLKREMQELSDTLATLHQEIAEARQEAAAVNDLLTTKKRVFRDYDSLVASHFEKLRQEERLLRGSIASLKDEAHTRLETLVSLRNGIAAIEVPEPDFSFAEQVAVLLEKRIDALAQTHDAHQATHDAEQSALATLREEWAALTAEKEALTPTLEKLRSDIYLGNDKNGKLAKEYLRLEERMGLIHQRERNAAAMEKRLSPAYRDLLADKLCKKCGNGL